MTNDHGASRRPAVAAAALLLAVGAAALVGCGDDESAQDRYCDAGQSLDESLSALFELDVIAEGTNGLRSALEDVGNDLTALRDSASDAAADEVDALNDAVEALGGAVDAAGDSLSSDSAADVVDAIGEVRSAFAAIGSTLADC